MNGPVFDQVFRDSLESLFRWRRDVRRFLSDPIPEATIDRLLSIAGLAPSVGLSEPWRFVRVESDAGKRAVREVFRRCNAEALAERNGPEAARYAALKLAGLDRAPCQLALFVELEPGQGRGLGRGTMPETVAYSAVLALHTLWLAARAEGIGLGWVSILEPEEIAGLLDVPAQWRFVAYVCVGWPEGEHEIPELERAGWEARCGPRPVLRR